METKKCSICGQELPLSSYSNWIKKDGSYGYLHCCLKCQRRKANFRHARKKKETTISKCENEVLMDELKRRSVDILRMMESKELIFELHKRGYCVLNEDKVLNSFSYVNKLIEKIL